MTPVKLGCRSAVVLPHDQRRRLCCVVNVTTIVTMNMVGIRELKSRLTHYVRLIKQGQNVIVTERGKPVAMLHGLEEQIQTREGRLARLATQGRIILPSTPRIRARRVRTKHPVRLAQAVLEDRAA